MLIIYTKNRLVNIYFNLLKAYINKNVFLLSQVKYYFSLLIVLSESIYSRLVVKLLSGLFLTIFSLGQMTSMALTSCFRRSITVSVRTRAMSQLSIILNHIC